MSEEPEQYLQIFQADYYMGVDAHGQSKQAAFVPFDSKVTVKSLAFSVDPKSRPVPTKVTLHLCDQHVEINMPGLQHMLAFTVDVEAAGPGILRVELDPAPGLPVEVVAHCIVKMPWKTKDKVVEAAELMLEAIRYVQWNRVPIDERNIVADAEARLRQALAEKRT